MKYSDFEMGPDPPGTDEGKLNLILEGDTRSFPGNASLMQFFQTGFTEGRIIPEHRALIEEEKHHTFQELDDISSKLAIIIRSLLRGDDLVSKNPDHDIVIGVCLPPSEKLIFSLFAILKLGAAYLPIDNSFPEDRVIKIVEGAQPVLIISDPHGHTISKFDPVEKITKVIGMDYLMSHVAGLRQLDDNMVEPFPGTPVLAERAAIVMYTSGSSGEPKGVRLSHRTIINRLNWQWRTFPYISHERCCFKTSLTFVDSVSEIFGPLLLGHPINIFGKQISTYPNHLIQRIFLDQITRIVLVPSLLRAILNTLEVLQETESKKLELISSVLLWVCSGETLPKDLLVEFFEKFPTGTVLCNFYGSTEIMGDVTYETFASMKDVLEKSDNIHVPIGRPIYNTIIYIMDSELKLVPAGESGEIFIAGYNLALGYVGIPISHKFIDNPYTNTVGFNKLFRTGDFGRIIRPVSGLKTLFFDGRIDSQIKIRGFRVDLSEIEAVIHSKTDLVENAIVLSYHTGLQDQAIVAFVIPKPKVSRGRVDMMFKLQFRTYEVPDLKIVKEIPLLVNGKVDRQRLLMDYEVEKTNATPYDNWHLLKIPEDQLKATQVFVEVMSGVTGTSQQVIVHDLSDSFFNLGGTSLNSITVIMKLRDKKYHISIADFVVAKSIHEIVAKMEAMDKCDLALHNVTEEAKKIYFHETLKGNHHEEVVDIIAYSFSHKGDLEKYTHASYDDFVRCIKSIWHELVEKSHSFIIRRKESKKIVAVALNFDAYDEPEKIDAPPAIRYTLDFLASLEQRLMDRLPSGKKKLWHSFMMGTHEEVDDSENVYLTIYMEEENVRLAQQNNFIGILTTNTNLLTQQICQDLLGYEVLLQYQVNHYEAADGTKPYQLAPDTEKVICCWKKLDHLISRPSQHVDS